MRKLDKLMQQATFIGIGLLIVVAIGFTAFYDPVSYPLEFTKQQNVLREPPVFHLDDSVDVEAVFINTTRQEVKVSASVHWILLTKVPELYPNPEDIVQPPLILKWPAGCTKMTFVNTPPERVIEITENLFKHGYTSVTWKLSGDNVITSPPDGSREFNVDEFTYIPDSKPLPKHSRQTSHINCENVNGKS